MALELVSETSSGVSTDYHNISSSSWTKEAGTQIIIVDSFVDHASRLAGKDPVKRSPVELSAVTALTLAQAYTALKALPAFSGASDV